MKKYAIGIDLGGTSVKYALIDNEGVFHFQGKLPSKADVSAEAVIGQLVTACKEVMASALQLGVAVEGIGIGTPGIVDETNRIVLGGAENIKGWENLNLADRIEAETGLPVQMGNDANLMGLGETMYGAGQGAKNVVFLTVGTGIGGAVVTGKMVYALRELGFDYVFDTDFAADLTIMEEGSEILNRLTRYLNGDKSVRLPILTSCCPAWVNFFEHHFPDMLDIPSTARSPQQMFGSIAKSYWAEKMGIPREKLVVVSIMPCLAKKYECARDEFKVNGIPDVDYSISTRELARLIKRANIGFPLVLDSPFDNPMGESTGAGVIFGTTGGVMEAALRSVYEIYTGEPLKNVNFEQVRGLNGVRRATINLNGFELKVGIAHGLGNARHLLEDIRNGHNEYHVIEIMACPGGCIGGGGQPLHHGNSEILYARANALYREDANKPLRKSHENPYIKTLYEDYLGKPLGEKSETLLHTHYFNKAID